MYQHSGVSALNKETALLLLTGFDLGRALQLIQFFEPKLISVGLQAGAQFDNLTRNVEPSQRELARIPNTEFFEFDLYCPRSRILGAFQTVDRLCDEFNLVGASLGPKPAAMSLYQTHRVHLEMALAYALAPIQFSVFFLDSARQLGGVV